MRLQWDIVPVDQMTFGEGTSLKDKCLTIDCAALRRLLAEDRRFATVDLQIVNPGDDCRIVDVVEVIEPRCPIGGRPHFPGVIESIAHVGDGRTRVLRGAAVVMLNSAPEMFKTVIDMTGPGAEIIPYARTANLCILASPAGGVARPDYLRALKEAAVKASTFLAKAVATAPVSTTEVYDLALPSSPSSSLTTLPRVAYIYMLASHQVPTEAHEPVLYGDNVRHFLPTVLHPNEVLDGAVLAPYWYFGTETYFIQNHPLILELYRRHGRELYFAGVVAIVAHAAEAERRRSIVMATNLVKETLRSEGVIVTKIGGGIPESDLMGLVEACEAVGVRTTVVVWTHRGDGRTDGSLTYISPRADALVSVGMYEEPIELPAVQRVVGSALIGPSAWDQNAPAQPAAGALHLRLGSLAGAMNQFGAERLSIEEY